MLRFRHEQELQDMLSFERAMRSAVLAGVLGVSALSGCTLGPDYVKPAVEVPASFKEQWKTAEPQAEMPRGPWWELFNDAELSSLTAQVEVSNQNIRAVEAQYRQARALVQQTRADYFPLLSANVSANRSKPASNISNAINFDPNYNTTYRAGLSASWEPDLWGRVQRSVEAGTANVQASAADIEAIKLSAQAELAQNYFLLRVADARKRLLDETVAAYQRSLELTQNQYKVGVVARADVVVAETQLKSTQAQAVNIGVARSQLEHAIAILIGKPPAEFSIAPSSEKLVTLPPDIPAGLPSQLLERRPDIAAAERRTAAANAQIGVAQAAYFPSLTLTGSFGYQSRSFADWFKYPSSFWALGPALAQTIFDGGLRKGVKAQTIAIYDENVANYRQTVLLAVQEVEDNLSALRILEREAELQDEAVKSANESVQITLNQYKAGIVDYLNVVNVETIALNNQINALNIQADRLTAAVLLIRAVGGGWDMSQLDRKPE
jgi:NodT family efflux transporter outer membrane factor (OMF) lipoprotein